MGKQEIIGVIDERVKELKEFPIYNQKAATVFSNAPLALEQQALQARIDELENLKNSILQKRS